VRPIGLLVVVDLEEKEDPRILGVSVWLVEAAARLAAGAQDQLLDRVEDGPFLALLLAVTTCAISISFRGCLRRCCLVRSLNDFHQFRATPRTLGAPPPSPWHLRYPEPAASPAPGSRAFRERSPPRTNPDMLGMIQTHVREHDQLRPDHGRGVILSVQERTCGERYAPELIPAASRAPASATAVVPLPFVPRLGRSLAPPEDLPAFLAVGRFSPGIPSNERSRRRPVRKVRRSPEKTRGVTGMPGPTRSPRPPPRPRRSGPVQIPR
jgi:hypothetical protein